MSDHQSILRSYQRVRERIRTLAEDCQRDPAAIMLLAVSKTHAADKIAVLADAGHEDFGESYAQELVTKAEALRGKNIRWHFVGRIQTNKLNKLLPHTHCLHAVDSYEHATAIVKQAAKTAPPFSPLPIYLSVNLGAEEQKSGASIADIPSLASRIKTGLPELDILGVMAVPPAQFSDENYPKDLPDAYRQLAALARQTGKGQLSLGMTADMRLAIAAGSTCLRIGTAIFGERT